MKTLQPSPDELLHHHLKYEFDMMNGTFDQIGRYDADPIVANALIEAFCVHARGLFEFFEKERGARSYTDAAYRPFDGGDEMRRKAITQKLNNQVAHVMDGRTADPSQKIGPADRIEMRALLAAEYAKFKSHLLPAHATSASQPTIFVPENTPYTATNTVGVTQTTHTNTVSPTNDPSKKV